MSDLMKPCLVCGEVSDQTYCEQHRPSVSRPSYHVGYNSAWRRLSRKARAMQPWCNTCGTTEDLTTDHLRWPATTLDDVQVLCRTCNSKKGAIRTRGGEVADPNRSAEGKAKFRSETPGGIR